MYSPYKIKVFKTLSHLVFHLNRTTVLKVESEDIFVINMTLTASHIYRSSYNMQSVFI